MTSADIAAALDHIAGQILIAPWAADDLAVIGIQRRGATLGERLRATLCERTGDDIPGGVLDITLYRDDLSTLGPHPVVNRTIIPFDVSARQIVLVDDVIYTGRTVRAALDVLASMGRPRRVALAVLVDRGLREYPIQPDFVGAHVATEPDEIVKVMLREFDDGEEGVTVLPHPPRQGGSPS